MLSTLGVALPWKQLMVILDFWSPLLKWGGTYQKCLDVVLRQTCFESWLYILLFV